MAEPDGPAVRAAEPADADAVARIFYETSGGWYDRWAGGREPALRIIRGWFGRDGAALSREVLKVAVLAGEVAGVVAAYPASEGPTRAGASLRTALPRLAPWRWLRAVRIFARGARRTGEPRAGAWYVDVLATDPGVRRRGVARALMEEVEREARAAGVVALGLETDTGNHPALSLYDALGFEVVGGVPAMPPAPELLVLVKQLRA